MNIKKAINISLILTFFLCNVSYAENLHLRGPVGDGIVYARVEEALNRQPITEERFKEVMGESFNSIRNFRIEERTGRYVFQKKLSSREDAWITYYYENSMPVDVNGNIDNLLALYSESLGEDKYSIEIRYLVFKRLARYRESAKPILKDLRKFLKKEKSKKVKDEIQVAINMASGRTIDGGKRLNVAFAFYELSPFVGMGGIKDVAKELPRTFHNKRGDNSSVFIPYWDKVVDEAIKKWAIIYRLEKWKAGPLS